MDEFQGRRREDLRYGQLHNHLQTGDYWKQLNDEGEPRLVEYPSNLTGTCWYVVVPLGTGGGFGIGNLAKHTVREHEDGTISVRPGDGSSNSILISNRKYSWHGYIEHGVFQEV
jgi:hypothetical protein